MSEPDGIERDYPLARLTTVRAGGAGRLLRAARNRRRARRAARPGRRRRTRRSEVVGSGSNLLVADAGVRGLVAEARRRAGRRSSATASAFSAAAAPGCPRPRRRRRGGGSPGLEFGINIPGTVGGAVRMNANAYGGELARVLEWVDVCHRRGRSIAASPATSGSRYRRSNLEPGRGRRARLVRAHARGEPADVKETHGGDARRSAARRSRRGSRPSARPSRTPTTRAPRGGRAGQLLEAAGCRGLEVGGARFSPKHANFVENASGATTADVLELMAEGRRRVHERVRRRARARGPGARRGRVAGRLGPSG